MMTDMKTHYFMGQITGNLYALEEADVTHSGGKPHETGDRGQRYEVRAVGWPKEDECVIGWTDGEAQAYRMMSSVLKAPGCTRATIFDRQENKNVLTRFGGVLR